MSFQDWSVQIGSVLMGPGTQYKILSIAGLGQGEIRKSDLVRPTAHGNYFGVDTYDGRQAVVSLYISGQGSATAALALYDALVTQWQLAPNQDTTQLTFQLPGRTGALALIGRPRKIAVTDDFASLKSGIIRVELEFYSAFHAIFSAAVTPYVVSPAAATSGRTYNKTFNYSYGGAASGNANVVNNGTTYYWPVILIKGPCINPFVQNVTTGQTFSTSITLGSSDTLTIDMDAKTMVLNGTASRMNAYVPGSTWWFLVPGSNNILYNATTGTGSTATVQSRDAYLG